MASNCFNKQLFKSELSHNFYMHLPTKFGEVHLPHHDDTIVLEDESGKEYKVVYSAKQSRFQHGWREFAIAHDLKVGDILVFHLTDTCKFKVQISRAGKSVKKSQNGKPVDFVEKEELIEENVCIGNPVTNKKYPVSRAVDSQKIHRAKMEAELKVTLDKAKELQMQLDDIPAQFSSVEKKRNEKLVDYEKGSKQLEYNVPRDKMVDRKLCQTRKRECEDRAFKETKNVRIRTGSTETNDVDGDSSLYINDTQINSSLDIEKYESALSFEDVNDFKDFKIRVNGETLDSEIPADMRMKYYQLCCGQNKFLHDCVTEVLNGKLVVEMIIQIISIVDSVKTTSLSTPLHHLESMDKTLKSFQDLGMAVGALRAKIGNLIKISSEYKTLKESEKLKLAEAERKKKALGEKRAKIDALLESLKTDGVLIKYLEDKVDTVKEKKEKLCVTFKEVAGLTW